MDFLNPEIEEYAATHTSGESELLQKVNRETHMKVLNPRMLSGHLQGRFLAMISKMIEPRFVLEVGTYTGYSALCFLEGLRPDGELHTIDCDEELADRTAGYFDEAKGGNRIHPHLGEAKVILNELSRPWDLVFLDADKENYVHYYHQVIDDLKVGGYLLADNVLWSGKVLEKTDKGDADTAGLKAFNKLVQDDDRVENMLLPLRDGLMMCRKVG
ncbi:MAG: class I SAM-dependent methyltransferase [Flavobacteriales bacterium]|nr:class I SAM-dependent methyltransferase [Flavobacteriales bacterium]